MASGPSRQTAGRCDLQAGGHTGQLDRDGDEASLLIHPDVSSSSVLQVALETLRSEATEAERSLAAEVEALRRAGRDREADLDTLRTVLQSSQDVVDVRTDEFFRRPGLGRAERCSVCRSSGRLWRTGSAGWTRRRRSGSCGEGGTPPPPPS